MIEQSEVKKGYKFHDLKGEGLGPKLANASIYSKFGEIKARVATETQEVITYINGKEETRNQARQGDYIVEGPKGEQYVVSPKKFTARYKAIPGHDGVFEAIGKIRALPNPYQEKIVIIPSWGGYQYGDEDCMLAVTVDLTTTQPDDEANIHIIDYQAFLKTYR